MKILLVYMSPNTTTRRISAGLSKCFAGAGHDVAELNLGRGNNRNYEAIDPKLFQGVDAVGIGSPIYHMRILEPLRRYLEEALPKMRGMNAGLRAFVYMTYGGITSGKAFINTVRLLRKNEIEFAGSLKIKAPHFWHIEGYPYGETIAALEAFCSALSSKGFKAIRWEEAEAHFSRLKPIVKLIYPLSETIGALRERQVEFDRGRCTKCGRCSIECPVGAIEIVDYPERDRKKCIYCYHCSTVCSKGAVILDVGSIQKMLERNKRIVGMEEPADEIFV